jgi:formylglycine-generating enzyme required for sulfatase activity
MSFAAVSLALGLLWLAAADAGRGSAAPVPALDDIAWVRVPPGRFLMGCVPGDRDCHPNERPRHEVVITQPYSLLATEVTIGQFDAFAAATGTRTPRQPLWNGSPSHPVVNVTWEEAAAVCAWLGGRLPTEAEWEFGARSRADGAIFPWGAPFERRWVNAIGRGPDDPWHFTAPVGSFPPNGLGLFDTSGNVWEWTADSYAAYQPEPVRDPQGGARGSRKVIRGGSWDSTAARVRTSVRHSLPAGARYNLYVGVRCAR